MSVSPISASCISYSNKYAIKTLHEIYADKLKALSEEQKPYSYKEIPIILAKKEADLVDDLYPFQKEDFEEFKNRCIERRIPDRFLRSFLHYAKCMQIFRFALSKIQSLSSLEQKREVAKICYDLQNVYLALLSEGYIDRALNILKLIPTKKLRVQIIAKSYLDKMVKSMAAQGKTERALELLNAVKPYLKNRSILFNLPLTGTIRTPVNLETYLNNSSQINKASSNELEALFDALLEKKEIEKAYSLATLLEKGTSIHQEVYTKIIEHCLENGFFMDAINLAKELPKEISSSTFRYIRRVAKGLMLLEHVFSAIYLNNKIPHSFQRENHFLPIQYTPTRSPFLKEKSRLWL